MRQATQRVHRDERATGVAEWSAAGYQGDDGSPGWRRAALQQAGSRALLDSPSGPRGAVSRRSPTAGLPAQDPGLAFGSSEWVALRDQIAAGARSLAGQMRALKERYDEEHRRLADTLEFLAVQSHDLEQELVEFGRLAAGLEIVTEPALAASARVGPTPRPAAAMARSDLALSRGFTVRCLGGFDIWYEGRPVELGSSRKGRLILKYLIVRAPWRRAPKELLAELFWPEMTLDRALPSLQSAVHQLRRALGQGAPELAAQPPLVFTNDHYGFDPRLELHCDVDDFRTRLLEARQREARGELEAARRAYRQALEAYGGELLPEDRYEDWIIAERGVIEADRLYALTRMTQLSFGAGDYPGAITFGRRLLELDGTREEVHRDLMRCFSRLGQRVEAVQQYRRCFQTLAAELELEPDPETTWLYERVAMGEVI